MLILLDSDHLNKSAKAPKHTEPLGIKQLYLNGEYGPFYQVLFTHTDQLRHVWLKGEGRLGLRAKHRKHQSGVSIATLLPDQLWIKKSVERFVAIALPFAA